MAPFSKARSLQSHEDWDFGFGWQSRMDESRRFDVIVLSCVGACLSDGPTPRSRKPTDCVKFLVSGLNSDMQTGQRMLKRENNFIQLLSSKSVEHSRWALIDTELVNWTHSVWSTKFFTITSIDKMQSHTPINICTAKRWFIYLVLTMTCFGRYIGHHQVVHSLILK